MKKSILLVDDEHGFHDLFRYVIEPLGIDVRSAYDGEAGLTCAVKEEYSLIFLDMHIPKLPGIEILEKVKKEKPDQKVVVISGSPDAEQSLEKRAAELGAAACLRKPFEVSQLLDLIQSLM